MEEYNKEEALEMLRERCKHDEDEPFDFDKEKKSWVERFELWDLEWKKKHPIQNWIDETFFKNHGLADYRGSYALTHPWVIVEYGFRQLKYGWQRLFNGYDERIPWSIDYYLDRMLPLWIERLKETKQGVPMCMFKDEDFIPDSPNSEMVEGALEKREAEFDAILQQIADGFRMHTRILDYEFEYGSDEEREARQIFNTAFYLFMKHYESLWD